MTMHRHHKRRLRARRRHAARRAPMPLVDPHDDADDDADPVAHRRRRLRVRQHPRRRRVRRAASATCRKTPGSASASCASTCARRATDSRAGRACTPSSCFADDLDRAELEGARTPRAEGPDGLRRAERHAQRRVVRPLRACRRHEGQRDDRLCAVAGARRRLLTSRARRNWSHSTPTSLPSRNPTGLLTPERGEHAVPRDRGSRRRHPAPAPLALPVGARAARLRGRDARRVSLRAYGRRASRERRFAAGRRGDRRSRTRARPLDRHRPRGAGRGQRLFRHGSPSARTSHAVASATTTRRCTNTRFPADDLNLRSQLADDADQHPCRRSRGGSAGSAGSRLSDPRQPVRAVHHHAGGAQRRSGRALQDDPRRGPQIRVGRVRSPRGRALGRVPRTGSIRTDDVVTTRPGDRSNPRSRPCAQRLGAGTQRRGPAACRVLRAVDPCWHRCVRRSTTAGSTRRRCWS